MNNYQKKARSQVLEDITIKCKECGDSMIQVIDLWDNTIVGYSCQNCPHYFLYSV